MAKTSKAGDSALSVEPNDRLTTTPEDKSKAQKWFQRAREYGEKRQWDIAIEYYVNGMEFWPDAVEEACKPMHGCAVARRQMGGKKPGLKETLTRSMTDKDAKKAFLNSLWLFGREPDNVSYIEGVARSASRLRAENVAFWAAGVCLKTLDSSPKSTVKNFMHLSELAEALGDRATARNESPMAVSAYQLGVEMLSAARKRSSKDQALDEALRHMSTKLTILKGKYKDGSGSYRDSIVDNEEQRELHDEQRSVQADERVDELISKAQKEYEESPDDGAKVRSYIDMLCRREREDEERKAIEILVHEFKRTSNYRWKLLADDIHMKQLSRKAREVVKSGDEAAIKEQQVAQLRYELSVFKERCERYPTDNRIKFEYAVRNFKAGRFDEAIPLLQVARNDPKNRTACEMYLGRCFFRKGYHDQAIPTLENAVAGYEIQDDELAKSLLYWLARAQEGAGKVNDAKQTYGKLLQVDYNYKDVRARMDGMRE